MVQLNRDGLKVIPCWILIVIGVHVYGTFGLVYAFPFFLLSAWIRGDTNKSSIEHVFFSKKFQYLSLVYYVPVLFLALIEPELIDKQSDIAFILIIGLPVLFLILMQDIKGCFVRGN